MSILDIILLICFVPAIVKGVSKGFIRQAVELLAILVGAWLAIRFSSLLSGWLSNYFEVQPQVMTIISFVLIVLVVALLMTLVANLLTKLLDFIALGWINRLLGFVFAILKVAVILGLAIMAFEALNSSFGIVDPDKLSGSPVYSHLKGMAETVFPYLKSLISPSNA